MMKPDLKRDAVKLISNIAGTFSRHLTLRSSHNFPLIHIPEKPFADMSNNGVVFDNTVASEINVTRLRHLKSLGIPLTGKSVLDVGCGVGHLSQFFVQEGCKVLALDARLENIQALQKLYPQIDARVWNIESEGLGQFGHFDIVFCYGLLYHLENLVTPLRQMASVCRETLLIETIITDSVLPINRVVDETPHVNQALGAIGHRPTPNYLVWLLERFGFRNVYTPTSPPDHPDFHFKWKNNFDYMRNGHNLRCIFIASKQPIANPKLVSLLPPSCP